jgi:hypothetical protein
MIIERGRILILEKNKRKKKEPKNKYQWEVSIFAKISGILKNI